MPTPSKILIVDDEAQIRGFLSLTFEQAGYVVKTAASGRDAIAFCEEEGFDVVLSDIAMPEMDGHELAEGIGAHRPATRTALMSGFDPGCPGREYSSPCDLIAKPFRPHEVVSFVAQILEGVHHAVPSMR